MRVRGWCAHEWAERKTKLWAEAGGRDGRGVWVRDKRSETRLLLDFAEALRVVEARLQLGRSALGVVDKQLHGIDARTEALLAPREEALRERLDLHKKRWRGRGGRRGVERAQCDVFF